MGADKNTFTINFGNQITSMSFSYNNDIRYTSGEDFDGVTVSNNSDDVVITVEVDRKASSSPATWFKEQLDNEADHMITDAPGDDMPGELNFAFSGVLTVNGVPYTVCLGQGNYGLTNNWWFGSLSETGEILGTGLAIDMDTSSCKIGVSSAIEDNNVTLQSGSGLVTAISYNGDLTVTSGAPYMGVSIDDSDLTNIVITVEADRQGSTDVASWYNGKLDNSPLRMTAEQSVLASDSMPGSLNFAFSVDLTVSGYKFTVYLGQGNYSLTNNWWFGSLDLLAVHLPAGITFAALFDAEVRNPRLNVNLVSATTNEAFSITHLGRSGGR
jgi:hypothetical protein